MIIENFDLFKGENCETTTVGNLLKHQGIHLSEAMLFGIGEGLNFIYWDSKQMGYPFLGGRCKQDVLTENIARNLDIDMEVKETNSQKKAWENVKNKIDEGIPVGLKLDCYYLDYFTQKIHFAAHYVTMYGYDNEYGYLIDTIQQGGKVLASLINIRDARNAKGPMSSRNRSFTMKTYKVLPDIKKVIPTAINNNAQEYLSPPIQNLSYKGIIKTGKLIKKWFNRPGMTPELITQTGMLMEKAGTGGALFRNMYRDFLKESNMLYPELGLEEAYNNFCRIAPMWTEVSSLICSAGENENPCQLEEASAILMEIAMIEEKTMRNLLEKTNN